MTQSVKVITDSVSDVPGDVASQLDITLVPTVVNIGENTYLDDGYQLTREAFYDILPGLPELPTTSACPLGIARDMIARKAHEAEHLLLIAAPAHLSGIYNTFRLAAEEVVPERFTLIDSGQVTLGAGFQAIKAAEMAVAGAGIQEIVAAMDHMRPRVHIYAVLNTLENLRKSGRVGWAMAMAGRVLQIKPVLELTEGAVNSLGNIRTFKRATARLIELGMAHKPFERLAVLHTNYLDAAYALRDAFASAFPPEEVLIVNVSPSLGTHVGVHGLGLALVTKS